MTIHNFSFDDETFTYAYKDYTVKKLSAECFEVVNKNLNLLRHFDSLEKSFIFILDYESNKAVYYNTFVRNFKQKIGGSEYETYYGFELVYGNDLNDKITISTAWKEKDVKYFSMNLDKIMIQNHIENEVTFMNIPTNTEELDYTLKTLKELLEMYENVD